MHTKRSPKYRLKVKALWTELNGWTWWYGIYDTERPKGIQIVITGARPSYEETLEAGLYYLKREYDGRIVW